MTESEKQDGVHESAAAGYASAAGTYEAGRPDYPAAAIDWLRTVTGTGHGRTILEVGAGTGVMTARLVDTGACVCAVEPVEAMRIRLARRAAGAMVVAGAAGALPIRDGWADAVVCATSFHWFAAAATLREFDRVLAPGGVLALIWNVRDERAPWVRRLSALTDEYESRTPRARSGDWRHAFDGSAFAEIDHRDVDHLHVGAVAQVVIARTMSVSFIGALPPRDQQMLRDRLSAFVTDEPELAGRSRVAFPYRTVMYAYRRRS